MPKELEMLSPWMFGVLFWMERFILKHVNFVSSISEGMLSKIRNKVQRAVLFFPNWVDTESFYPLDNREALKEKWGYQLTDTVVLYSGSIGEKQGLDSLIRIAQQLQYKPNIQFIICGTGPYKEELMRLAKADSLTNMKFLPLQDYAIFNEFLNMADIHLVLQKANASDLVMPSKLTAILSVGGLALATASPGTTLHDVIDKYNMGIVITPEDEAELAGTIVYISESDQNEVRKNARAYAIQFLNKHNILSKMMTDLN